MNDLVKKEEVVTQSDGLLQVIERAAMNPEIDVEKMERLLDMKERLDAKAAEMAFNSSLAEMQDELPVITERGKITVNGEVRSSFAKFEDINEIVKPILKKYGFAISFKVDFQEQQVSVTAILVHKMGHRESTTILLPRDKSGSKNEVQAVGSSVAYGKRYTMNAILNITTRGEDDDGILAAADTITEEQALQIHALLTDNDIDVDRFKAWLEKDLKCDSIEGIKQKAFNVVMARINAKIRANKK